MAEAFQAELRCGGDLFGRFNAAPSQTLPLLRPAAAGGRELTAGSWGFPMGRERGPRPINARSETAASKPGFREALRHRRIVLPATGFYEWAKPDPAAAPPLFGGEAGSSEKAAWLIEPADRGLFALAGLAVRGAGGEPAGFCVLTTRPNAAVAVVHDRMPVLLPPGPLGAWLDPATELEEAVSLLEPAPVDTLVFTPIDRRINKPSREGPTAVRSVGEPVPGATFAAPAA